MDFSNPHDQYEDCMTGPLNPPGQYEDHMAGPSNPHDPLEDCMGGFFESTWLA